jgi:hypothetical protein
LQTANSELNSEVAASKNTLGTRVRSYPFGNRSYKFIPIAKQERISMKLTSNNTIAEILERHKAELLAHWLKELQNTGLPPDDFAIAGSQRLYSRAR